MSIEFKPFVVFALLGIQAGAWAAGPQVVRRWDFASPDDAVGWRAGNDMKDLGVADGRLRMTLTGPDAFLYAPLVDIPLDGCIIRLRLRCDRDGDTQLYWQTDEAASFDEQRQMTKSTPGRRAGAIGEDSFVTVDFPIGKTSAAGRKLTAFRIDPYNGANPATVEIDSVELLRQPPVVLARFAATSHWIDVGQAATLQVALNQVDGAAAKSVWQAEFDSGMRTELTVSPTSQPTATDLARFDRPGVQQVRVRVRPGSDRPAWDLETSVIVGRGGTLPLLAGLRSDRVRLDLIPHADGKHVGAARWQIADTTGRWRQVGWLLPLAELTIQTSDGQIIRRQPMMSLARQTEDRLELQGTLQAEGDWRVALTLRRLQAAGLTVIEVTATASGPEGARLLDFAAVTLLADRDGESTDLKERFAVFGGIEFLEPGWRSSSERAVGDRFANRLAPHPFKVTLPVMAVEAGGVTSALAWNPLDQWDGHETMPTATFASPNFRDGQANHFMRLSVPTIPRWRQENEDVAREPYVCHANQPITLRGTLIADTGQSVVQMGRRWYEIYGTPTRPPAPHDERSTYDLLARHLGETAYWPKEKGWRHHWYLDKGSTFHPIMAGELIAHALETGDRQWVEKTSLASRTLIDTLGPLRGRLRDAGAARAQMAAMRPDGTWAFVNSPQMRKTTRDMTNGRYDSLGEDGSTSVGTCVQAALPILRHALLSGDEACVQAAIKALDAMMAFRVPRGAQVWEVHQEIPDIRAAALAVEAFQIGYELTGNRRYLDEAGYWAWTGVPFLYSWHVPIEGTPCTVVASRDRDDWRRSAMRSGEAFQNPDRQVTPFGSVPVLGPTFYVINWYGVLVQWCGLEWAWKVIELDRDRPDPLLRYIADGVVLSGLQQMFDRPPWIGLYPDVWDMQSNCAQGAFIGAFLPMNCLQAQGRLPEWTKSWTRVLPDAAGQRRVHVSGWGRPVDLPSPVPKTSWSATVAYLAGQPNELILTGVDKPHRVRVADQMLESIGPADVNPAAAGWHYAPDLRAIMMRFVQTQGQTTVRIDW